MRLLDACLALALTLAVFASSATVLVELLQRAFRTRVKQLRAMLGVVFDRYLADALREAGADVATLRVRFVDELGQRRGARRIRATGDQPRRAPTTDELDKARTMPVDQITIDDILRRLAGSKAFRQAFAKVEQATLRPALEALVAGFERLEVDASALFAARARMISFGCGIFLALAVNVDAVRLFNHYASDSAETAKTIAALAAARPANSSGDVDAEKQIAATIADMRDLSAVGVPVGLGFFPYCMPPKGQAQFDKRCTDSPGGWKGVVAAFQNQPAGAAFWLLCVLVTGFLIGLGGPYWFDVATSLGQWRNLLRGLAGRGATPPDTAAEAPNAVPPAPTFQQQIDAITQHAKQPPGVQP